MRLDAGAAARIAEQLGDDMGRLDGIVAVLHSTFGEGVRVTRDRRRAVPRRGRRRAAVGLHRRHRRGRDRQGADDDEPDDERRRRHPLQIMAILHSHYAKLARLDGVDARSERDAAEAMGIKPGFPAKKALGNYQRLGGGGVKRAIGLLAAADLDLRGATDLDSEMVMEVRRPAAPPRRPLTRARAALGCERGVSRRR